jgi:transcription termination factor Rho
MPRKAATVSKEPEANDDETKNKPAKRAAAAEPPKKTASRKKVATSETAEVESTPESSEPKLKRAPRKKAATAASEETDAPASKGASASVDRTETTRVEAQPPAPAAAPPAAPAPAEVATPAPAPVNTPEPAPAREDAGTGAPKPRPLYIPREVEAFLRAAGLPIPTEKPQLDAIMSAMNAAKMAAQQATSALAQQAGESRQANQPAGTPPAQGDRDPRSQQPGGQPQQFRHPRDRRDQRHQHQQREPREFRDNREQREPREPREDQPNEQSEQASPREPEPLELVESEGYCEIAGKGFGFIRDPKRYFQSHPSDVFVTPETVKKFGLRDGQWLKVEAKRSSRGMQIHRLLTVNDQPPEAVKTWPSFEDLTTISPIEHIRLETVPDRTTTRIIDLLTPIGKGQRGLIVAPPRTGKTTLLNHIAQAVVANHPDIKLMILLVDERPEEVTDFKRNIPQAELWASSNDMEVKSHTRIAQLAMERAKRLVESGSDVFILLDSITRLGRAFNNAIGGGGRTMSGGVDSRALETPRKIFAAARNTEEAGSLTIVATALIDTGSRMDELIFQEFKGTGNSEIVLDRKISDQRIYPAIDIFQSGTRREELLLPADALQKIGVIRRGLAGHKPQEAIERVLSFLKRFPTNEQLLKEIPG